MEMKGLKENKQEEKGKLEHGKMAQNSSKLAQTKSLQRKSPKAHPSEFILDKLGLFSSNSPKRAQTHLSEKSLSQTQLG